MARQICLHQLEYAPRTRAELATTLAKKGIEPDVADEVEKRIKEKLSIVPVLDADAPIDLDVVAPVPVDL